MHSAVIMITVPMAIVGVLLGLILTQGTLNIYSQIGMVMLVGIASKNGILIVEFINQLRDQGMAFEQAIVEAARICFRPVIMTTISTAMGAVPLIIATGAGSESWTVFRVVIFSGIITATLLTLFVVPAFYHLLARHTKSRNAVTQKLDTLIAEASSR